MATIGDIMKEVSAGVFSFRMWLDDNTIELKDETSRAEFFISLSDWGDFVKEVEAANRKLSLIRKVIREDAEELLKQTLPKGE